MSNQSGRHAAVVAITGRAARGYEQNFMEMFDDDDIPAGPFNQRLLVWLNEYLEATHTTLAGAQHAFAVSLGFRDWNSLNTWDALSSYVGPLDYRTGAFAAWGLKKLYSAYAGACVRVRRSSDNAEQDIGFASDGNFDGAAANTFKGAGTLFAVTFYDQSGNGRNWGQSTAANQPGVSADGPGGDWCLTADGTTDYMTLAATANANPNTYYFGLDPLTWGGNEYLIDSGGGDNQIVVQRTVTPNIDLYAGSIAGTVDFPLTVWSALMAKFNGASSELRRNKLTGSTGNTGAGAPTGTNYLFVRAGVSPGTYINVRLNYLVWFAAADNTAAQNLATDALAAAFGISV